MELKVTVCITSDNTRDPDDVPTNESNPSTRYWGAWDDSPQPNVRTWVLFNREPTTEAEAHEVAKAHLS